jgi:hypothetical protein
MLIAEISSNMPPPTWNDGMEMPKKCSRSAPTRVLMAMTRNAEIELTRMVFFFLFLGETLGEQNEKRDDAQRVDDREQRDQRLDQIHRGVKEGGVASIIGGPCPRADQITLE